MEERTRLVEVGPAWITAISAAHTLAARFGDREAKATLLSRLQDGAISFAADVILHEADQGTICADREVWATLEWRNEYPRQRDRSWVVTSPDEVTSVSAPVDFFARDQDWKIDADNIDWRRGQIVARRPAQFRACRSRVRVRPPSSNTNRHEQLILANAQERRIASGLRFRACDIAGILEGSRAQLATPLPEPSPAHLATRQKGKYNFRAPLAELERAIREGRMCEMFGSIQGNYVQSEIANFIRPRARNSNGEQPSPRQVDRYASKILIAWRKHDQIAGPLNDK